jgi:hypothetical protein
MSPAALRIDRLTATLHVPGAADVGTELAEGKLWLDRVQADLAEQALADALDSVGLPTGYWFVRRVDLPVRLDPTRPAGALAADWAACLAAAIRRTALARGSQIVHYPDDAAAVADCLRGLVTGQLDRSWAWSAAGLITTRSTGNSGAGARGVGPLGSRTVSPDPGDRRAAVLALAAGRPHQVTPAVLGMLTEPGAVAALDRILGPDGWVELVRRLLPGPPGAPFDVPDIWLAVPQAAAEPTTAPTPHGRVGPLQELASRLVTSSAVAARLRHCTLRPPAEVRRAWALLVVLETDPGSVRSAERAGLVTAIARLLAVEPSDHRSPQPAAGPDRDVVPQPPATETAGVTPTDATAPAPPPATTVEGLDDDGRATDWAGLAFLLAAAQDAGIPGVAVNDPVLAARTLRWTLFSVAGIIAPVAPDDPARLLLAGLPPDGARAVVNEPSPTDAESVALAGLADAWARAAAERLVAAGAELDGTAAVAWLARRPGTVAGRAGWLEVRLSVDTVDIAIRRAGLDIDPGWVPWLGTVVRYRYV